MPNSSPTPIFEIGDRNVISRSETIQRGETITLFDINLDVQQGWQLVYQFSGGSQQGEIEIETFSNIASFSQMLDWSAFTGDFVTGKGSFKVRVNNQSTPPGGPSLINAYITTENFLDDVASFTQSTMTTSGIIGTFGNAGEFQGHIPFPFNSWSIFTSSPIDVRYVDQAGGVVATYPAIAINDAFLFRQFMPKRLRLQVAGTVASQLYTIQWSRK